MGKGLLAEGTAPEDGRPFWTTGGCTGTNAGEIVLVVVVLVLVGEGVGPASCLWYEAPAAGALDSILPVCQ